MEQPGYQQVYDEAGKVSRPAVAKWSGVTQLPNRAAGAAPSIWNSAKEVNDECHRTGSLRPDAAKDQHLAEGNHGASRSGSTACVSCPARGAAHVARSSDRRRSGASVGTAAAPDPRDLLRGLASGAQAHQGTHE